MRSGTDEAPLFFWNCFAVNPCGIRKEYRTAESCLSGVSLSDRRISRIIILRQRNLRSRLDGDVFRSCDRIADVDLRADRAVVIQILCVLHRESDAAAGCRSAELIIGGGIH